LSREFNLVKNKTTPWACFKDPESDLVYFIHSKCACSFYKQLFLKLGWRNFTSTEIDWNKHVVFSHIRDPLKKHRIGLIEWFYFNKKTDILENNSKNMNFFIMLSQIAYLDHHSLSIYEHLGTNSSLVHWIPIDHELINHKQHTIEFIEQHSSLIDFTLKDWFAKLAPTHQSTGFKKTCYNTLMDLPVTPLILKSIEYDRCLYDLVTKPDNFEPVNYQSRIKQLEDAGYTNVDAQQIADNEVANGEYLKWINKDLNC
jgi:hypothetical protein